MPNVTKHNFGAGPCVLPQDVLKKAADAVMNWDEQGLSVLEVSHRSPAFEAVVKKTETLVRELLQVPEDYSVLFLQGGASLQFCMVPMNFLRDGATYLDGGFFSKKAIKEAELFGAVNTDTKEITGDYFHCTSNNTIEGSQMKSFPDVPNLICDMSSDIFSRPINVSEFALIYAGAQKNMGPAGMTLVIARDSFLDDIKHQVPAMLDYRVYRDNGSMYNTPPVFAIYAAMLNLQWLQSTGGVPAIYNQNKAKAEMLYAEIDRNPLFTGTASVPERSLMNVTFKTHEPLLEPVFLAYAESKGLVGIKGYRTVGGFRASLYNALPLTSVIALVDAMQEFENSNIYG